MKRSPKKWIFCQCILKNYGVLSAPPNWKLNNNRLFITYTTILGIRGGWEGGLEDNFASFFFNCSSNFSLMIAIRTTTISYTFRENVEKCDQASNDQFHFNDEIHIKFIVKLLSNHMTWPWITKIILRTLDNNRV